MKILAFSDVHGNVEAVEKLYAETQDADFDLIIFGGDFTNEFFEGFEKAQVQMNEFCEVIKRYEKPFYYVYGNRDMGVKCPIGNCIEEKDWEIGSYTLTNQIEKIDKSKILVNHYLHTQFEDEQVNALLYLYGHDHIGRIYKNYIDLGFLYRGMQAHGAMEALYGCYWFIEINDGKITVENNSWDLRESTCDRHPNQGIFYIPYYYRRDCTLCYNEIQNRLNF